MEALQTPGLTRESTLPRGRSAEPDYAPPPMRRLRLYLRPRHLLLAAILLTGFALRVWHNGYGLPFVWSLDEGNHFTSHAVGMFRSGLNPGYYQNPAAYTYLVYALLRLMYGPLGFHLRFGNVTDQFAADPTGIWEAARAPAARHRGGHAPPARASAGGAVPRRRRPGGGARLHHAQPLPVLVLQRFLARPPQPGRRGGQPAEARPGARWLPLLPREPGLGTGLGRARRGCCRRGARAEAQPLARPAPGGHAARAVRLPERAVALLRTLAPTHLSSARHAGRRGARAPERPAPRRVAAPAPTGGAQRPRARPARGRRPAHRAGAWPERHAPGG